MSRLRRKPSGRDAAGRPPGWLRRAGSRRGRPACPLPPRPRAPATSTCSGHRRPRAVVRRGGAPRCWMARGPVFTDKEGPGFWDYAPTAVTLLTFSRLGFLSACCAQARNAYGLGPGGPVAAPCLTPHGSVWHHPLTNTGPFLRPQWRQGRSVVAGESEGRTGRGSELAFPFSPKACAVLLKNVFPSFFSKWPPCRGEPGR